MVEAEAAMEEVQVAEGAEVVAVTWAAAAAAAWADVAANTRTWRCLPRLTVR